MYGNIPFVQFIYANKTKGEAVKRLKASQRLSHNFLEPLSNGGNYHICISDDMTKINFYVFDWVNR
jgi:hypothetical protein